MRRLVQPFLAVNGVVDDVALLAEAISERHAQGVLVFDEEDGSGHARRDRRLL